MSFHRGTLFYVLKIYNKGNLFPLHMSSLGADLSDIRDVRDFHDW